MTRRKLDRQHLTSTWVRTGYGRPEDRPKPLKDGLLNAMNEFPNRPRPKPRLKDSDVDLIIGLVVGLLVGMFILLVVLRGGQG